MDQNSTTPLPQTLSQAADPTQAQPTDAIQSDVAAPAQFVDPAVNQPQVVTQPQQQVDQTLTAAPLSDAPQPADISVTDAPMASPAPAVPNEPTPQPVATPAVDAQSAVQAADQPQAEQKNTNYIEDVGNSVLELLDDIDDDEKLQQIIANEMRLDTPKVKAILTGLLDKVDQGQITKDELALLMAAPVVDDISEGGQ